MYHQQVVAFNKVAAALIFEAYLPTFSERNVTEHRVKPVLSGHSKEDQNIGFQDR